MRTYFSGKQYRLILESGMIDLPCHKTADPDLALHEASERSGCQTPKWISGPRGGSTVFRSRFWTTFTTKTSSETDFHLLHEPLLIRAPQKNDQDLGPELTITNSPVNFKDEKYRTKVSFRSPEHKERARKRLLHSLHYPAPP